MTKISYSGYRFPAEIIHQAIWLYLRFTLSFRDVEDLLADRGMRRGCWTHSLSKFRLAAHTARKSEMFLGKFERAKSDISAGIALSPRYPLNWVSYWYLGGSERGLGNLDAAIDAYRKSIESGGTFLPYEGLAARADRRDASRSGL